MSRWAGKFVIGLTGNIATGKSVVRRMLEHLGAYGINADALTHRVLSRGAPGYSPVVELFGKRILNSEGEIDRQKLGKVVFHDPNALTDLESIVHPFILQAIDLLIKRAHQKVVAIEAIKLIESGLSDWCDSVWVTTISPELQYERLTKKRMFNPTDAQERISAQSSQAEKIKVADIVINNAGSFEDTWTQVMGGWKRIVTEEWEPPSVPVVTKPVSAREEFTVEHGRPSSASEIAAMITRVARDGFPRTREDIMEAFGEKALILLRRNGQIVGVAGWQVENLVSRTTELHLQSDIPFEKSLPMLVKEIEGSSKELQCEVSLIFVPTGLEVEPQIWEKLGYVMQVPEKLDSYDWQQAALESMPAKATLYFRQLRNERVLRPI
ncbi:MAG: dephospho-CoA kinase [Anaerolineaceae bacterium]|nr:dephospho-CoA kinase [Anaerolineaceae bacterium]